MADNIPAAGVVPDVGTNALPTPYSDARATPETFGAGVGQQLEQQGAIANHLATVARNKANETAVQGAEAAARAALNTDILDPESGFLGKRGADAMGQRDSYLQRFNGKLDQISGALANDDQRRMFAAQRMSIHEQGLRHALSHETVEMHAYSAAQTRGNIDGAQAALENIISNGSGADLGQSIDEQVSAASQAAINDARSRYGATASKTAIAATWAPEMQKLALGALRAAAATQNPDVLKVTLDKVGRYVIDGAKRDYSRVLDAMTTRQLVTQQSDAIFNGGGVQAVEVPAIDDQNPATMIGRPDPTAIAAALSALPSDSPHAAEIEKAVEQRQKNLDRVWGATVDSVADKAQSQGQNAKTGEFSIDKVDPTLTSWLNQYAPKKLAALRALDQRAQRQNSAEEQRDQRNASRSNYGTALAWIWNDANRVELLNTTRAQFGQKLMDDSEFPGGLLPADRARAIAEFAKSQKAAQDLRTEKIRTTLKEEISKIFPEDTDERKAFDAKFLGDLNDQVNDFAEAHKGEADTKKLRDFIRQELMEGKVVGSSSWYWRDDSVRRIEAQTNPTYAGKTFHAEGAPDEVLGQRTTPPAARTTPRAAAAPSIPRVTNAADFDALPSGTTFIDPNGKTRRKP